MKKKSDLFQLIDHYTLFYYEFIKGKHHGKNFWQLMEGKPQYNNWCGRAFERVCLWHTDQIKQKLGISGVLTNEYAWRYVVPKSKKSAGNAPVKDEGIQIDLLIDRNDDIIDLCEMKYSSGKYAISEAYMEKLDRRKDVFREVTKTRKALHTVFVTTEGLVQNAFAGEVQNEVCLEDLFC